MKIVNLILEKGRWLDQIHKSVPSLNFTEFFSTKVAFHLPQLSLSVDVNQYDQREFSLDLNLVILE